VDGRWSSDALADRPDPPRPSVAGRALSLALPERYYVEIRFYDQNDVPSFGIWY
jgi:hypothetical protein